MMKFYALMMVISTLVGLIGFLNHSITAGIFGCFNGLIFVYSYMVLYSLFDMYGSEYEQTIIAHEEAKSSKQIYKDQILNANELLNNSKVPLVSRKIEEI
jgi:hypothetical protein